jgi:O-antigen ligase
MATSALSRSGETSEITTATGRVDIWRFCFSKWLEAPWFGYGLGSPRRVIPDGWSDSWGFTTGTAHNFVLESLLSVGVIGTLPLLAVLFGLALGIMRLLRRSPPAEMRPLKHLPAFMVACWSFLIIEGCFEKTFAGLASPATVILAVLLGSLVALKNLPRAESR